MSAQKPVPWSRLPDEELKVLGQRPTLAHATGAITDSARRWGRKGDGLVIVHQGVLDHEGPDGIIHSDALAPMHAAVAFGEVADGPSSADRLACAIALLSEHAPGVDDATRAHAQRVVSDTLLEHPVLLHPRLVIPFRRAGNGWTECMPVLAALVASRAGALPSKAHGVDEELLRLFANSSLAKAPFTRKAPEHAWMLNDDSRMLRRQDVIASGEVLRAAGMHFGSPSPAFLAAVLEMRRLDEADKEAFATGHSMKGIEHEMLRQALPLAFGLHRHLGLHGLRKSQACPAYLDELKHSGVLLQQAFISSLPALLGEAALVKWTTTRKSWDDGAPAEVVRENIRLVLDGLVVCGLAKTRLAAASWLYEEVLGDRRPLDRTLPETGVPSAIGFLQGLADAGLYLGDASPNEERQGNMKSLVGNAARWQAAHDVCSRQQAMDSVLRNGGPVSDEGTAPRRRLRAV